MAAWIWVQQGGEDNEQIRGVPQVPLRSSPLTQRLKKIPGSQSKSKPGGLGDGTYSPVPLPHYTPQYLSLSGQTCPKLVVNQSLPRAQVTVHPGGGLLVLFLSY